MHYTIKQLPEDERPRERMITHGVESLSDAELLAVILGSGGSGETAIELARRVLAAGEGNGLPDLARMDILDLMRIRGVGKAKACRIKAAIEIGARLLSRQRRLATIRCAADVYSLMMPRLSYLDREHFIVVLLSTKNQVLGTELVSVGCLNASLVHPREIFKTCVKRSAASVILVHNHPSGDPSPSPEDVIVTRRLIEAGRIMGIDVLDHVIIGDGRYISLRESGIEWSGRST